MGMPAFKNLTIPRRRLDWLETTDRWVAKLARQCSWVRLDSLCIRYIDSIDKGLAG